MYEDDEYTLWNNQNGGKFPYSTISYANGPGFYEHFTNDSSKPWKNIQNLNYTHKDYRSPAMNPNVKNSETHGGEDVPVLANGPWSHMFSGVHEQSYFCHAIELAAGWRDDVDPSIYYLNGAKLLKSQFGILVVAFLAYSSFYNNWQ